MLFTGFHTRSYSFKPFIYTTDQTERKPEFENICLEVDGKLNQEKERA